MAVLRVSSYRRLFEEERWGPNSRQYSASARRSSVDECDCDKLDFVAARTLNKTGLDQFVHDRSVIAALNDRLVNLIQVAHCFEEENETLEQQIWDLKENLNRQTDTTVSTGNEPVHSLDAVVDRLQRQRDEILCDTEELNKELQRMQNKYEEVAQQRILIQQERQMISEEVDAATAKCLALREQVAIYEEQLASMEAQHSTEVESLLGPDDGMRGAVTVRFSSPDITQVLNVKEYYAQLAQRLQCECGGVSSAKVRSSDGTDVGGIGGSKLPDLPKMNEDGGIEALVSELQKELSEMEKCNEELVNEVEMKEAAYEEEIAELELTMEEMRQQESSLQAQMNEQMDDFQELLREKMARDLEIVAYRSLVEEEEMRLCCL
ncbi:desmin [Gouania willdenowi]|nr:desmin-like [Gouania willdenowi]